LVERPFFDTSVLVAGVLDLGEVSEAPQTLFDAIHEGRVQKPQTAWHCCLEFFAVVTRMPPDLRLAPGDALQLVEQEILDRFEVHQLPTDRLPHLFRAAVSHGIAGGRIYDLHIAEVALSCHPGAVITENRRHFTSLQRQGLPVLTAAELLELFDR
jgi:hypothetical protein